MSGVREAVAKKKTKPGPKPNPQGKRDATVAFKCYRTFKDWLDAEASRQDRTHGAIVALALACYAKEQAIEPPPKR